MPRYKKVIRLCNKKKRTSRKRNDEDKHNYIPFKKQCTISTPNFIKCKFSLKRHMTFSPSKTPKRKCTIKYFRKTTSTLKSVNIDKVTLSSNSRRMLEFENEAQSCLLKNSKLNNAQQDANFSLIDSGNDTCTPPENEIEQTKSLLTRLVKDGKFSTSCISYCLFRDALHWHDCQTTSGMRYSEETKEFFWTGQKLLGGQFIRFMRGFAHHGHVKEGRAPMGYYNPSSSGINLPVPSDRVLSDFKPKSITFGSDNLEPGILKENINIYGKSMKDTSFAIMFDGKKITPNSADIFLLNQEDEPRIEDIKKKYHKTVTKLQTYQTLIESMMEKGITSVSEMSFNDKSSFVSSSKSVIYTLSTVIKSLRIIHCRKAIYIESTEKKLEETHDGKYKFVVNKIKTLLYQINICIKGILEVIDVIMMSCASANMSEDEFKNERCNMTVQKNYRELRSPEELKNDIFKDEKDIPLQFVKQRSKQWFSRRQDVKVTGSVAYKALGLESLSAQKAYFDEAYCECRLEKTEKPEGLQKALDHGTLNEINAIATLVSKVMPVYFPEYTFHEEGAYVIENKEGKKLMIISPDGSLRNGTNVISVELKCPFSVYVGATPVYYEVKNRHMIQNCLEANVLKADEHLYVSWSPQSTTVFRLKSNKSLYKSVIEEIEHVYYNECPSRPTKISDKVIKMKSDIKEDISKAEFIGEFASVTANSSPRSYKTTDNMYYKQQEDPFTINTFNMSLDSLVQNMHKAIKNINEAHTYEKPMASEVLVYLLSDMSRTWHREIGHGMPITYLFKGYSLTMSTARRILDEVMNACSNNNVHVPCTTFDGQFAKLKDVDKYGKPLTLFALQRQVWLEIKKKSKRELLIKIGSLFNEPEYSKVTDAVIMDDGEIKAIKSYFQVHNKNKCLPVETPIEILHKKICKQSHDVLNEIGISDSAGLEEDVLSILETLESQTKENDSDVHNSQNTNSSRNYEGVEVTESSLSAPHVDSPVLNTIQMNEQDFTILQKTLVKTKRKKWHNKSHTEISTIFKSATVMNSEFTGQELNEIVKYLNMKGLKHGIKISQNLRKTEKINKICSVIGITSSVTVPKRQCRKKNVTSLKTLCVNVIQKRSYPKDVLSVAYARSTWPCTEDQWFESSYVEKQIVIKHDEYIENETNEITFSPVYSPEYVEERQQLEVRILDGTHLRTNLKSKLIRHGLGNVHIEAWKKVANTGETDLAPAMLEVQHDGKIMHQQSDPYVRTMFSEKVESVMIANGDYFEANFCKLFRQWHEAEDKPGISAFERCYRSINFRNWLMENYDYTKFPPVSQYVKGIPRCTFESLVCSIDAHVMLYSMVKTGTYNWRAVSTLVAENFMGELAERSQNNHGVPSGNTLPSDMSKISQLHAMRLNPERSFQMKTSKSRCYEIPDVMTGNKFEKIPMVGYNVDSRISEIITRDHEFDQRRGGVPKHGTVRKLNDIPRGVQPVRSHYKVDESRILPSLRQGISEKLLDELTK